jgi:hypothetical protein
MLRGLFLSLLVHALVLGLSVMAWPIRKTDCERQIEKLERDEPGLDPIDIAMRLPQCSQTLDIPIDIVDVGLIADLAAIPVPKDETDSETVPDPADETIPETEDPDDLTPEEDMPLNRSRAEEEDPTLAEDPRADKKTAPDKTKMPDRDDPLVEKSRPKATGDLDFLDDIEDQLRSESKRPRAQTESDEPPPIKKPVLENAQTPRPGAGERKGNTASLQASMRRQIEYCWRGIDDLPKEDQYDVVLDLSLTREGALAGEPDLVSPSSRPGGRAGIPVETALRAVRKCAPYKLPPDDYQYWKDIRVTIGPK